MADATVVLINPTQDFEKIYGKLAKERSALPPLGLCSLAGALRKAGYSVRIIDAPAMDITNDAIVEMCAGSKYIGITATTDIVLAAGTIARKIKERMDCKIIVGGFHVSALPQKTLAMFPAFDIGVLGEGEDTIVELICALEKGADLRSVRGIVTRDFITQPRGFIDDLDRLEYPSWDLVQMPAYHPAAINYKRLPSTSLVTSRGCPSNCSFCDNRVFGSRYRTFSGKYILEMIRYLKERYGIRDICFYDSVFAIFKDRLKEICDGLRQEKYRVSWSCQARVNAVDYDTLRTMKDAGCWKVRFGIESGASEVLKMMNKRITIEEAHAAVNNAKRAGLEVDGYFIIGFPGETHQTLAKTRDFISKSNIDMILLSYFLPYPGSPIYDDVRKHGEFKEDWEALNAFDKPQFIPTGLTSEEIVNAQKEIYRSFYLRPRTMLRQAGKMIKNPTLIKSAFSMLEFME